MIQLANFQITNVKKLANNLALFKTIIKGKNPIPVLDCVKLQAQNGILTITGTDLDTTLTVTNEISASSLDGEFCLHLQTLLDAVKKAKLMVEFNVTAMEYEVNDGTKEKPEMVKRLNVKANVLIDSARLTLEAVSVDNFPEVDFMLKNQKQLGIFAPEVLQELFKKSAYAATTEQSRFTLHAIALEFGNKGLRTIGTDGHRLAMAETLDFIEAKPTDKVLDSRENHLLNLTGVAVLHKAMRNRILISANENHVICDIEDFGKVIARKPPGRFPSYRMVLPKDNDFTARLNPKELAPVVADAVRFADERTKSIGLQTYYNNFVVKSGASEQSFSSKGTCDFPQNSAPPLSVNGAYLLETFRNCEKDGLLTLDFKDTANQFQLSGENNLCKFLCVIMPLRDGATFEILTEEEKESLKLTEFKAEIGKAPAPAKTNKRVIVTDIQDLLKDLRGFAESESKMPDLLKDLIDQTTSEINLKLLDLV